MPWGETIGSSDPGAMLRPLLRLHVTGKHPFPQRFDMQFETPDDHLVQARALLRSLELEECDDVRMRLPSGHHTSIPLPCKSEDGRVFILKYFVPPAEGVYYPAGVRMEDYPRREAAFYRFLQSTDRGRVLLPVPQVVLMDSKDPPRWLLLERIPGAIGPAEEILSQDHVFELIQKLQAIPKERLMGRRDFPLNHWDPVSYLDRIRLMYDPVLFVIGEQRWTWVQTFFKEALRWTDTRKTVLVHGDFTESNIMVNEDGEPFLLDFERIGFGNEDHDIAWFWIHTQRDQAWKANLINRWFGGRVGSDRIRAEWGIRSTLAYMALRRLRFGYLMYGDEDERVTQNVALLDAVLQGGGELFPIA